MSLETMTKLFSTSVGVGGIASITFSNIPQNYTDLVVKFEGRISSNGEGYPGMRFNGDTGANYSQANLRGNGAAASSSKSTGDTYLSLYAVPGTSYTGGDFSTTDIQIPNYSGNTYKTILCETSTENNATASYPALIAAMWSNSSPVTSITLMTAGTETLAQYTSATLYGIKNAQKTAGNSIKATGGNIVFDGTYVYHVFPSTGAFAPTQPLTADVLVVAGGGAGGVRQGGGGGAGGVIYFSPRTLSPTSYTCTVGAGGA